MRVGALPAAGGRRTIQRSRALLWTSPNRPLKTKVLLAASVTIAVILLASIVVCREIPPASLSGRGYTIVINTFKRSDLLKRSVSHYASCSGVESVRVIWSEEEAPSPPLLAYVRRISRKNSRDGGVLEIKFDLNEGDSLNNRFNDIQELRTDAIFSVDDDVLVSCASLDFAFRVWGSAPAAMVGFVPRIHWWHRMSDGEESFKYGSWWEVWRTGTYSMVLTKAAFFHRKYLRLYSKEMSASIRDYVTRNRNCEDIAMSFLVANETAGPPVWVEGRVRETGSAGISSLVGHGEKRSQCINDFVALYGRMPLVETTVKAVDARRRWLW